MPVCWDGALDICAFRSSVLLMNWPGKYVYIKLYAFSAHCPHNLKVCVRENNFMTPRLCAEIQIAVILSANHLQIVHNMRTRVCVCVGVCGFVLAAWWRNVYGPSGSAGETA